MCTFITIVTAAGRSEVLDRVMAGHAARGRGGRRALAIDNSAVRAVLGPDEAQYLLTGRVCDCGTVLGAQRDGPGSETATAAARRRFARRGWSEARIARALHDVERAQDRRSRGAHDDAEYWRAVLGEIGRALGVPRVGLMHHFYGRDPATEVFPVGRRDAGPLSEAGEILALMEDGVVHDFCVDRVD